MVGKLDQIPFLPNFESKGKEKQEIDDNSKSTIIVTGILGRKSFLVSSHFGRYGNWSTGLYIVCNADLKRISRFSAMKSAYYARYDDNDIRKLFPIGLYWY